MFYLGEVLGFVGSVDCFLGGGGAKARFSLKQAHSKGREASSGVVF